MENKKMSAKIKNISVTQNILPVYKNRIAGKRVREFIPTPVLGITPAHIAFQFI